ncbi:nitronate monooxygenase, partial [Kozakia baliensis]|uniref:nitronate monooxygenase n=1 Tax=Kozakia baliensis TaxID=153496 RepID=UPI0004964675
MNWLDRLGITVPIIQAPMAGVSTPALAAAVSNAGALGSIGVGAVDATGAHRMIVELQARTERAFNVNLFVHATPKSDPVREAVWLEWMAPFFAEFGATPPRTLRVWSRGLMGWIDDESFWL